MLSAFLISRCAQRKNFSFGTLVLSFSSERICLQKGKHRLRGSPRDEGSFNLGGASRGVHGGLPYRAICAFDTPDFCRRHVIILQELLSLRVYPLVARGTGAFFRWRQCNWDLIASASFTRTACRPGNSRPWIASTAGRAQSAAIGREHQSGLKSLCFPGVFLPASVRSAYVPPV